MPRLLDADEVSRQLTSLPGVVRDSEGSLALVVKAPSFPGAVRLVERVAADAEELDHHPDIDLRWRTVCFRFATHSAGGVTQLDVELARRVLAEVAAIDAEILPPVGRVEVALDAADPDAVRPFWRAGLGYREQPTGDGDAQLQDRLGRGPVLWFQRMDPPRRERGRFHLDVYVPAAEAAGRIEACVAAGGTLVSQAHAPSWWVLADPEGNELCICVEPDPAG
jgi:4a-hydroxytetrahydrobiopterin dehydratase